jgi:pyruvate kinase
MMAISETEDRPGKSRTKIVATVGPACSDPLALGRLIDAGVDVFRLNMAHGTLDSHGAAIATIRALSAERGRPVAVLVDLSGPKIRLGELPGGKIECRQGEEYRFVRGEASEQPGELVTSYDKLVDELDIDDRVMIADGSVGMRVIAREPNVAVCRVTQPGLIRSRQGVNLPGVKLSTPAMTPDDREHAIWAARQEVDFVGLSFVRAPQDIEQLKQLLREHQSSARAIAKIEKPEALVHLEAIIRAAGGVMIARGDLGVEIDIARVPLVQKEIIAACRRLQKPVITATQMLDSMQVSSRPTRAEASDVANAILDGADACMLSGETAIGKYPVAAVEMMNRIAVVTESSLLHQDHVYPESEAAEGLHPVTEAVVHGASIMAHQLDARLLVVASRSGATALALAKQRNIVPAVGVSELRGTLRQMCLYWGITPLPGLGEGGAAELIEQVVAWGRQRQLLASGDRLVVVSGTQTRVSGHNLVMVHQIA